MRHGRPALTLAAAACLAAAGAGRAEDRPCEGLRVGLALSGGGAKGFAHLGVLRALEARGIRPHAIAGTSMGAVIGGLYAMGLGPDEIAAWASAMDWKNIFASEPGRGELPLMERDWRSRHLLTVGLSRRGVALPTGLTAAQRLQDALLTRTARVADVPDFDHLPIPFRAVATDLVTGEEVVLSSGSLAEALRASLSVPVAFTPVEVQGRLLVDGGIVKNLPVDVVRAMGCDVVVAVDVSAGLRSREELASVVDVVDQIVGFQMVASTREQRDLADLVIEPDLRGISIAFESHEALAARGLASAEACLDGGGLDRLCGGRVVAERPAPPAPRVPDAPAPRVRRVRLDGAPDGQVLQVAQRLRRFEGLGLDLAAVQQEVERSYATGAYERLSVAPVPAGPGEVDLLLSARTRHPTSLSVGARYDETRKLSGLLTFSTVSVLPGRLTADFRFGTVSAASLQYFQSARRAEALFVLPRLTLRDDFQDVHVDGDRIARLVDRSAAAELSLGLLLRKAGVLELWYRYEEVEMREELPLGRVTGAEESVASVGLSVLLDTLERPFLPERGIRVALDAEAASDRLGGDAAFRRAVLKAEWHRALGDRLIASVHGLAASDLGGGAPIYRHTLVGGPELVPGLEREELRGARAAGLSAQLSFKLLDLPLGAGRGVFLRAVAGAGTASGHDDDVALGEGIVTGLGLGLAADTLVGPVLLDAGVAEGGRTTFTLSVGHAF